MQYDMIYEFIPYLEEIVNTDIGFKYINKVDDRGMICFPYVEYSQEIQILIRKCYDNNLFISDFENLLKSYYKNQKIDFTNLESCSLTILLAHLSYILGQERFCEGTIATYLKNGTLLKIIKLIQIRDI